MDLIEEILPFMPAIPFTIALIKFKSLSKERLFLFAVIVLAIVGEYSSRTAAEIWKNNMPIIHVYTLLECFLLLSVFYHGKSGLISRKLYRGIIGVFVLLELWNLIFYQGINEVNSLMRSLEGIILITLSMYFFFVLLKDLEFLHPERTFMFWFSIAVLTYFSGNLLVFIYSNHLAEIAVQSSESFEKWKQVATINYILNIFLYILYAIAFLCKESKTIPKSSWSAP